MTCTKDMDVVFACLTCLDWGGNTFVDQSKIFDKDNINVGVRYVDLYTWSLADWACYAQILMQLDWISV